MFFLGRAHLSHPAKHVLVWAVGGGWPLSQAQHWVANKTLAELGSPSAGRQTPDGGRPWTGLTRPGPVRLAKPAAATLANAPLVTAEEHNTGEGPSYQRSQRCLVRGSHRGAQPEGRGRDRCCRDDACVTQRGGGGPCIAWRRRQISWWPLIVKIGHTGGVARRIRSSTVSLLDLPLRSASSGHSTAILRHPRNGSSFAQYWLGRSAQHDGQLNGKTRDG
jgi:hypothetical protein